MVELNQILQVSNEKNKIFKEFESHIYKFLSNSQNSVSLVGT